MRLAIVLLLFTASLFGVQMPPLKADDTIKQAIVKIYTVAKVPDYISPWNATMRKSTGSGSIIAFEGKKYILTNAHVVADQAFIEVQRYGERKRYIATVAAVSHQADLALLQVEKQAFFKGVTPLALGTLPYVEQRIVVYGYPMGGNTLSATIGVVSRVEHHVYAHSGESFLSVQVDAAVNPGNSGGPAISGGKIVGVAMQVITRSQNIGYLVPVTMVRHFLEDFKDGKIDGFADLGLVTQKLTNPALRRYYKIDENQSGILVDKLLYHSSFRGILQPGDILTAVDGHKIEDDGTAEFRKHEYTNFYYFVDKHQMGDEVCFDLIRAGKALRRCGKLKYHADDMFLVKTTRYDKMPTYYIYGGYVFSPVTRNLIRATARNRVTLSYLASQYQTEKKQEIVVLLKVLASDMSRGYYDFALWPIEKINGKRFATFKAFYDLLRHAKGEYITLENKQGVRVIIDRKEALAKTPKILKKYNIEFDRSEDLRNGR